MHITRSSHLHIKHFNVYKIHTYIYIQIFPSASSRSTRIVWCGWYLFVSGLVVWQKRIQNDLVHVFIYTTTTNDNANTYHSLKVQSLAEHSKNNVYTTYIYRLYRDYAGLPDVRLLLLIIYFFLKQQVLPRNKLMY